MLNTVLAFALTLGVLVTVHEYGHYRMAVACGVRVLRFSVGFGRPLLRWTVRQRRSGQATEFVIAAVPLGGYVNMLDERQGTVAAQERHQAFNTQSLRVKAAIVAAGPLANLLLAVLLYALLNWWGGMAAVARLGSPVAGSLAERAGFQAGEQVLRLAAPEQDWREVVSFEDFRWRLNQAALDGQALRVQVQDDAGRVHERLLPLQSLQAPQGDAAMWRQIGWLTPWSRPVISRVLAGSAAERAGLRAGDLVLSVDDHLVGDSQQLRDRIRAAVRAGQVQTQDWQLRRAGEEIRLMVEPELRTEEGVSIGLLGLYAGEAPQMVWTRHGALDGLALALEKTWDVARLSLRTMAHMLTGEASTRNLSGPLSIADFAGRSLQTGWAAYLSFLALVSVSLGVFNLIPLPVLDGGHLLYYLCEHLTGRRLSERWQERLQRAGVALILALTGLALFNDISRLWA